MSLEAPEKMAQRVRSVTMAASGETLTLLLAVAIEADREHIAAKCEEWEGKAQREADAHPDHDRSMYCDGQASAFRAAAAMLRASVARAP